jgi:hypothetical protein
VCRATSFCCPIKYQANGSDDALDRLYRPFRQLRQLQLDGHAAPEVLRRKELIVDFIEKWFGISPDGGDGSLEALYLFAVLVVVAAIVFRARIRGLIRRQPPRELTGAAEAGRASVPCCRSFEKCWTVGTGQIAGLREVGELLRRQLDDVREDRDSGE